MIPSDPPPDIQSIVTAARNHVEILREQSERNSISLSRHPIFWLRHLSAFALHDLVECDKVRAIAPLSEKRRGVHGRELLRYRSCHELVDAGAIGLGAPHDFGLY
jgi:hypothetical protein